MLPKGMGNVGNMVKHAMQLKDNIERLKDELADETVEASSGGGMVTVVMNGKFEVISLSVEPTIVDKDEIEMMETLIQAALNEAARKAQELVKTKMSSIAGGMDIPGLTS